MADSAIPTVVARTGHTKAIIGIAVVDVLATSIIRHTILPTSIGDGDKLQVCIRLNVEQGAGRKYEN